MVVQLGSKCSGIPVLKVFMVAPVIMVCELNFSKYLSFTSLVNTAWLKIVDIVLAGPMLLVLIFL